MLRVALERAAVVAIASVVAAGCTASTEDQTVSDVNTAAGDPTPVEPEPIGTPADVELPVPMEGTAAWLRGDGAPLVEAVVVSAPLVRLEDDADQDRCRAIAESLDAVGGPDDLATVAGTGPDEESRTLLLNDLTAKMRLLGACLSGDGDLAPLVEEASFTHGVVLAWFDHHDLEVG